MNKHRCLKPAVLLLMGNRFHVPCSLKPGHSGRCDHVSRYILDANGEPASCPDLLDWGRWFETADTHLPGCDFGVRHVARTRVGQTEISTVFLGLDHDHGHRDTPPVLWETMVFSAPDGCDDASERYSSRADAEAGHARAVAIVRDAHGEAAVLAAEIVGGITSMQARAARQLTEQAEALGMYKTTDYCARCGDSPTAASHVFDHKYEPARAPAAPNDPSVPHTCPTVSGSDTDDEGNDAG